MRKLEKRIGYYINDPNEWISYDVCNIVYGCLHMDSQETIRLQVCSIRHLLSDNLDWGD